MLNHGLHARQRRMKRHGGWWGGGHRSRGADEAGDEAGGRRSKPEREAFGFEVFAGVQFRLMPVLRPRPGGAGVGRPGLGG